MPEKKPVVITIGGVELTIPPEAKVKDIAAAAGVTIPRLTIDAATCKGCQLCLKGCESGAISGEKKTPHVIDQDKCVQCGECLARCKTGSVVPA